MIRVSRVSARTVQTCRSGSKHRRRGRPFPRLCPVRATRVGRRGRLDKLGSFGSNPVPPIPRSSLGDGHRSSAAPTLLGAPSLNRDCRLTGAVASAPVTLSEKPANGRKAPYAGSIPAASIIWLNRAKNSHFFGGTIAQFPPNTRNECNLARTSLARSPRRARWTIEERSAVALVRLLSRESQTAGRARPRGTYLQGHSRKACSRAYRPPRAG